MLGKEQGIYVSVLCQSSQSIQSFSLIYLNISPVRSCSLSLPKEFDILRHLSVHKGLVLLHSRVEATPTFESLSTNTKNVFDTAQSAVS